MRVGAAREVEDRRHRAALRRSRRTVDAALACGIDVAAGRPVHAGVAEAHGLRPVPEQEVPS